MKDVLSSDGKVIGVITSYRGDTGPLIYGNVPIVVDASSPAPLRIFAAISSRESPLRATPSKPVFKAVGAIDGVQGYEKHGVSAGSMQWISRNGNLQRLLRALADALPDVADEIAARYEFSADGKQLVGADGEPLSVEEYRSTEFCVWLHELLGCHFMAAEATEEELAEARATASRVQCDEAWKLITERDDILRYLGWLDAVNDDERLRLITASMAINVGIATFKRMLAGAKEKTAKALTANRIHIYQTMGAGFGVTRSNWELSDCDLVVDGQPFRS